VLSRMGLLEEIRQRRTSPKPWVFVDERGRRRAGLPADFAGGDVEILRGDLSRVLYEATRDDTEYLFGDRITGIAETPHGVHVTFQRATPRTFDLVIGADGMHSGVRSLAFGPEERYSRYGGAYFASFNVPAYWQDEPNLLVYNEPGRMVSPGLLVFRTPPLHLDRADPAGQKEIVAGAYAGAGWRTAEIIEAVRAASEFYLDSISMVRLPRITSGRFALLGDAAHGAGLGGMGTGASVVGAYVLAGELAAAAGDHTTAFPAYEEIMVPYARRGQGIGAANFLAPATRGRIRQRNLMTLLLGSGPMTRMIGRMDRKIASNITLKDYS
ncbi:MAG TPA: FAD-dependent monooxygenase, partial [Micromonosporaceae bacterium]|nr:FAD-dependent monooxygenase [Micromonosporaceae bacterium]